MDKYVLIAVVGKTDPIRSNHDGAILHIIRHYHPKRVILLLSEEIGKDEKEYHYNERAIKLLDEKCEVETVMTGIIDVHSYDNFPRVLLNICNQIKNRYLEDKIILDITSGTPQLETALCMIALSDPSRYLPIQVTSPAKSANKSPMFMPKEDSVEEWFKEDKDNEGTAENRCHVPQLTNFKRPLIQFQIISLIENYDYAGALRIYQDNQGDFSKKTGLLLEHAKKRLNLEEGDAKRLAQRLGMQEVLYPIKHKKTEELVEYYNSMRIKQLRGELNDFVLRIEVLMEYLAVYILECCMNISLESISYTQKKKNSDVYRLDKRKCVGKMPGIDSYLDQQFGNTQRGYEWGKPLNGVTMVQMVAFMCMKTEFKKYKPSSDEMQKWTKITSDVRNPAAHTIIAITDELIKRAYSGNGAELLCGNMKGCLKKVFDKRITDNVFDCYDNLNQMIRKELEK